MIVIRVYQFARRACQYTCSLFPRTLTCLIIFFAHAHVFSVYFGFEPRSILALRKPPHRRKFLDLPSPSPHVYSMSYYKVNVYQWATWYRAAAAKTNTDAISNNDKCSRHSGMSSAITTHAIAPAENASPCGSTDEKVETKMKAGPAMTSWPTDDIMLHIAAFHQEIPRVAITILTMNPYIKQKHSDWESQKKIKFMTFHENESWANHEKLTYWWNHAPYGGFPPGDSACCRDHTWPRIVKETMIENNRKNQFRHNHDVSRKWKLDQPR